MTLAEATPAAARDVRNHDRDPENAFFTCPLDCALRSGACHFVASELTHYQIFDTANFNILVGPKGLREGEELTVRKPQASIPHVAHFGSLHLSSFTRLPNGIWHSHLTASAAKPLAGDELRVPRT